MTERLVIENNDWTNRGHQHILAVSGLNNRFHKMQRLLPLFFKNFKEHKSLRKNKASTEGRMHSWILQLIRVPSKQWPRRIKNYCPADLC